MSSSVVICVFRKDLRLLDNEVLSEACKHGDYVLPLFCYDPRFLSSVGPYSIKRADHFRIKFLHESLRDLDASLRKNGSRLVAMEGHLEKVIVQVVQEIQACPRYVVKGVFMQRDVAVEEIIIERVIAKQLASLNIPLKLFWTSLLHHVDDLPFDVSELSLVFTQYRKLIEQKGHVRASFPVPHLKPVPEMKSKNDEVALSSTLTSSPSLSLSTSSSSSSPLLPRSAYSSHNSRWWQHPPLSSSPAPLLSMSETDSKNEDSKTASIPDTRSAFPFVGGETAALKRVKSYLWDTQGIRTYKTTRNGLLGSEYSSKFAPWLALGCVSSRVIYHEILRYEATHGSNESTYWLFFELLWREYFQLLALHTQSDLFKPFGIRKQPPPVPWTTDTRVESEFFDAWKCGRTGVPFVDANMRELAATGFMSNRGRQNVASFFCKDLCLDWRVGAMWFESQLIDYDAAANYGNWQYQAGVGTDPRESRKFNVIKQGKDYDPDGTYIRLWVPELSRVPTPFVHHPWTLPIDQQRKYTCVINKDYPKPVVTDQSWRQHCKAQTPTTHKYRPSQQTQLLDNAIRKGLGVIKKR